MRKIRTTPVGGCIPHRTGAMQDAGYGLPRIHLLRLSEKSRRAPSQSPTSPKTRRNSPDFAVVCQPNVRSRHHSAPFRTVSEGVFCEVGLRHNAVLRSSTLLAAFYTMSATAWVGSGGEGGHKRICRPNRTKLLCFASMKKSGTRAT